MVNGDNFQRLGRASVFEEDVQGQISLLTVYDRSVPCAVTDVKFCRENGVTNL